MGKMAIYCLYKDSRLKLTNFAHNIDMDLACAPVNNDDEKTQTEIQSLKEENIKLQKKLNESKHILQSTTSAASINNERLSKENQSIKQSIYEQKNGISYSEGGSSNAIERQSSQNSNPWGVSLN